MIILFRRRASSYSNSPVYDASNFAVMNSPVHIPNHPSLAAHGYVLMKLGMRASAFVDEMVTT